jgi:SAM-dependent methyltransferase
MASKQVLAAVERYYTEKLEVHGATPQGVDWNGHEGQQLRFDQLLAIIDGFDGEVSILDYGCGYGALLGALADRGNPLRYQGYDISSAMVAEARTVAGAEDRASFTDDVGELVPADFVVASGIFNVKLDVSEDEWQRYIFDTLDRMVLLGRQGIAFNALTSHSDPERMRPHLHYANPGELLDHCLRRYSRDVVLRHDYELYEFTMLVRLDRRPPVPGA